MSKIADRLVVESQADELKVLVAKALASSNNNAAIQEVSARLNEELSTGDWTRLGVVTGLLWYKLDSLVDQMKDSNQSLKAILDELRKRH